MTNHILLALWFFLPAGVANAAPPFANKIPGVNRFTTPLDFGKTFRGKRIFGENKTWRGLLSGMIVGAIVGGLQYWALPHLSASPSGWPPLMFGPVAGALLGLGALIGDAVESFLKRQLGVKAGQSLFPLDQIDYIIGGLLFISLFIRLSPSEYLTILGVWFIAHIIVSYIGYLVGLKPKPI